MNITCYILLLFSNHGVNHRKNLFGKLILYVEDATPLFIILVLPGRIIYLEDRVSRVFIFNVSVNLL